MMIHPNFDPVLIHLGPLAIRWYALSYIVGFCLFIWLGSRRIKSGQTIFTNELLEDLFTWGVFGVILGGRLGYVLFYQSAYYFSHPLDILKIWQGGMSFHGGFINGELWGRVTSADAFWAMGFPHAHDDDVALVMQDPQKWLPVWEKFQMLPRHPSQLYEFMLEGIVLFVIMWLFTKKPRPLGQASMLFLLGYGVFRFIVEFAREPDDYLGLLAMHMSMGQWLSLPMIVIGAVGFAYTCKKAA